MTIKLMSSMNSWWTLGGSWLEREVDEELELGAGGGAEGKVEG